MDDIKNESSFDDRAVFLGLLEQAPVAEVLPIKIYTDGACSGNPGLGGWAAMITYEGSVYDLTGAAADTTNNRMEMMAALKALAFLPRACKIDLYTDSQYVKDGVTLWMKNWKKNGWLTAQRKPVKNQDLWEALDAQIQRHQISWHWVRGHSGDENNEHVDLLARNAIIAFRMKCA